MKNIRLLLLIFVVTYFVGCKKSSTTVDETLYNGTVVVYSPANVAKTVSKRIFSHVMPWFESKESNSGQWGQHWKMANKNPDVTDGSGKRQIASYYYPMIGPYASGDYDVIEYQLLLMKLSGVDGVMIDWPGKQLLYDYPFSVRNTERMVAMLEKVGLTFSIVYEDRNLVDAGANKIAVAQNDMNYLQSNFFGLSYYEKVDSKPLLLDFGPIQMQTPSDWTSIFSVLSPKPSFFTLWYESGEAGSNASGEYAWIYSNYLTGLNNFYNNGYTGKKIAAAYPGFKDFYTAGGWGGALGWQIDHNGTATFNATLDAALASSSNYIQLCTWNDYGEGTMIEPTQEFGYGFLTSLQTKLGVSSLSQTDLETVNNLYTKRKAFKTDTEKQKKLDQVFYYMVSLQMEKAKKLLNSIT
ncbi:glycoside hydrolase family 71/99-like protein [Ferruginibacter sp. SUN002]|uniref:glycoside hydrolase family 71/99-like protein n=1 Tax=Ferruginibacter sp. SUN002 TaxID=2937789 RepID=UPI003D364B00